jgi:hypothetical protein
VLINVLIPLLISGNLVLIVTENSPLAKFYVITLQNNWLIFYLFTLNFVSKFSNYVFLCQVFDKQIITLSFSYQIPHQFLVRISIPEPTDSLADISGPSADKGFDMNGAIFSSSQNNII